MSGDFQAVLDGARPDAWKLRVLSHPSGAYNQEFSWPRAKGTSLAAYLRENAVPDGKYRVEAVRLERGQGPDALKSARTRMRRRGPLTTVVSVGDSSDGAPSLASPAIESRPSVAPRGGRSTAAANTAADPEIEAYERETRVAAARAAKLRAERELFRIEREAEFDRTAQHQTGASELQLVRLELREEMRNIAAQRSGPPIGAIVTALVPVAQTLIQSMIANGAKQQELVLGLIGASRGEDGAAAAAAVAAAAAPMDAISGTLPLLRQLVELGKELSGDGGGDKGTMGEVAELISALGGLGIGAAPGGMLSPPTPTTQRRPAPTPGQTMKLQVIRWLGAVQEYATNGADPEAVADALEPALRLLPAAFRELLLGAGSVEAVLPGLSRWMPPPAYQRLTGTVRGSESTKRWLAAFLDALQSPDDAGDDDAGDDDAGDSSEPTTTESPFGDPVAAAHADFALIGEEMVGPDPHTLPSRGAWSNQPAPMPAPPALFPNGPASQNPSR